MRLKVNEVSSRPSGPKENGDRYVITDSYVALIDGASPKSKMKWNNRPGDAFVADILAEAVKELPEDLEAEEALEILNKKIEDEYQKRGLTFKELSPDKTLEASIVLINIKKEELWLYGDINYRINGKDHYAKKNLDTLTTLLRSYYIHKKKMEDRSYSSLITKDVGREMIVPILQKQGLFANQDSLFGYPVLNGDRLNLSLLKKVKINEGDKVVLQTDGYPVLADTLKEAEDILLHRLKCDPECISMVLNTKGLGNDRIGYDDRTFLSFEVEK